MLSSLSHLLIHAAYALRYALLALLVLALLCIGMLCGSIVATLLGFAIGVLTTAAVVAVLCNT